MKRIIMMLIKILVTGTAVLIIAACYAMPADYPIYDSSVPNISSGSSSSASSGTGAPSATISGLQTVKE